MSPVFLFGLPHETLSEADLKGATAISLVITGLIVSLAYAPSLLWLRSRLGSCRPIAIVSTCVRHHFEPSCFSLSVALQLAEL